MKEAEEYAKTRHTTSELEGDKEVTRGAALSKIKAVCLLSMKLMDA